MNHVNADAIFDIMGFTGIIAIVLAVCVILLICICFLVGFLKGYIENLGEKEKSLLFCALITILSLVLVYFIF